MTKVTKREAGQFDPVERIIGEALDPVAWKGADTKTSNALLLGSRLKSVRNARAVVAALDAHGLAVVSKESSIGMCQAMHDGPLGADDYTMCSVVHKWLQDMWRTGVEAFDSASFVPQGQKKGDRK